MKQSCVETMKAAATVWSPFGGFDRTKLENTQVHDLWVEVYNTKRAEMPEAENSAVNRATDIALSCELDFVQAVYSVWYELENRPSVDGDFYRAYTD